MCDDKNEISLKSPPGGKSIPPATGRTPAEIRHNDIVSFIVNVRKLSAQTLNIERNMRQIKNMSNTIFRHYIGYTSKGEYRIKHRKERCFSEEVARLGLDDPFDNVLTVTSSEKIAKACGNSSGESSPPDSSKKNEPVSDENVEAHSTDDDSPASGDQVPVVDLTDFVPVEQEEFEFLETSSENLSQESCSGAITFTPDGDVVQDNEHHEDALTKKPSKPENT